MTDIPFFVVVVSDMVKSIGAVAPVVAMVGGDNAANGDTAADMRVGAVLEGVVGGSTVWAAWVGVVREREGSPTSVVVPRS